jgi:hypothetical protein
MFAAEGFMLRVTEKGGEVIPRDRLARLELMIEVSQFGRFPLT